MTIRYHLIDDNIECNAFKKAVKENLIGLPHGVCAWYLGSKKINFCPYCGAALKI